MQRLGFLSSATFIVFLVLKLNMTIAWPWFWVTAPLWIYAILFIMWMVTLVLLADKICNWQLKKLRSYRDQLGD